MNKEIKDKWLEALRSGDYQKTKHALKQDDKFCCLGVLCDLYRKETGDGEWIKDGNFYRFKVANKIDDGTLPLKVRKWAELGESNPSIIGVSTNLALSQHNDWTDRTFNDIAELIETKLAE